jgi:hypothetical protein
MAVGPKRGYKQSAEHIAKRIKRGPEHHHFTGDSVSVRGGRSRALRAYSPQSCEKCGNEKADRHHKDGNTANNTRRNIEFLCRRCHMSEDGRLAAFREQSVTRDKRGDKNPRARISEQDVVRIRQLRETGLSLQKIAFQFGIATTSVHRIVRRISWSHV